MDIGNLISDFSAFSKSSLNTWKFMVHVLLKPGLENFEHYFASVWDECSYAVVLWHCLSLGLEWIYVCTCVKKLPYNQVNQYGLIKWHDRMQELFCTTKNYKTYILINFLFWNEWSFQKNCKFSTKNSCVAITQFPCC